MAQRPKKNEWGIKMINTELKTPTVKKQLFQPFVTSKPQGMGIGLSISHTIIEAHGGKIWAEPNEGGGTRFCLTLPAASVEDIDERK